MKKLMKLKKEEIIDLLKFGFTLVEELEPIENKKYHYLINFSGKPYKHYIIFNLDKRIIPTIKKMSIKKFHDIYKYHYTM